MAWKIKKSNEVRITQQPATKSEIQYVLRQLTERVLYLVNQGFRYLCLSTGTAKKYLLNEPVNGGPTIAALYDSYLLMTESGVETFDGFMSFLKQNYPHHYAFAKDIVRMVGNEEVGYLIRKGRGPPFIYKSDGDYIKAEELDNGDMSEYYICDMLAIENHQKVLDLEERAQAYVVGVLQDKVKKECDGVVIAFLFEIIGAGARVGTVAHSLSALSLTSLKSSAIQDGKLAINAYRSHQFQKHLTLPLSKSGTEDKELLKDMSRLSICDSYVRRKKMSRDRRAKRASNSDINTETNEKPVAKKAAF